MNITISSDSISATISTKGAELISLKNNKQLEFIWNAAPEFWAKHSPVLFPIVGTLKNNSYEYNGKKYSLPRHGFARDMVFALIENNSSSATFSLTSNEITKQVFPFEFEFKINYHIESSILKISYEVINKSENILPFSLGAHPAFALPDSFESYSLKFEKEESLLSNQLEDDLLSEITHEIPMTNQTVDLRYSLFEKDALIFKKIESKKITLQNKTRAILTLHFEDFSSLGIWTKIGAPFICLEPWLGYSDLVTHNGAILEKEGILKLESNTTFQSQFGIELL